MTSLQWEYEQALQDGGGNIGEITSKMLDEYKL
jgi:hypothetical protein